MEVLYTFGLAERLRRRERRPFRVQLVWTFACVPEDLQCGSIGHRCQQMAVCYVDTAVHLGHEYCFEWYGKSMAVSAPTLNKISIKSHTCK
jgi:hypothetical protein